MRSVSRADHCSQVTLWLTGLVDNGQVWQVIGVVDHFAT
jgi:hypothetical protein